VISADVAPVDFRTEREAVDRALEALVARHLGAAQDPIAVAIRYSIAGEGKRLRAILLMAAYRAVGGRGDASALGAAVEVVHAYSLVHDDLPCMDDDDMRRGRPTVHRAFSVRTATAAGMAMVPLAAHAAVEAAEALGLGPAMRGEVVRILMRASGASGMIGGQLLDLEGEGLALDLAALERIHRCKTGALIEASFRSGALAGGTLPALVDAFGTYEPAVGLAFQIADDVLDVTATTDELGKTAGKDVQDRKSTYPALLGVDGARTRAEALVHEACAALRAQHVLTVDLERLARFVVDRRS